MSDLDKFIGDWNDARDAQVTLFKVEIMALKAENERLRKAGDAMLDTAIQDSTGLWLLPAFENWIKAKEKTEKEIGAIAKETLSKEGRDAK